MGTNSFVQQKNRQACRVMMITKVRAFFKKERAGCNPVENGQLDKVALCPQCDYQSLIQYYTKNRAEVIRVCFHRYNPISDESCDYTDKIDALELLPAWVKAKAKKVKAAANVAANAV